MNREADVQTVLNTLGHDLRSPLFTAHGFLQLVVSRTEGKANDHARHALASVEEAARMVEGVLQWARTHGSRTEVADLELDEVAEGIQRDIAGLLRRYHVRLDVGPLPRVRGDKRSLHYALQHLIDNAVRHGGTPVERPSPGADGGSDAEQAAPPPQRTVWVRGGSEEGTWWVEVEDDGPGITGDLDDLRVPFWQTPNRGSGAGIALAERVAVQHGGRLEIVSSAEGTRARITGKDRDDPAESPPPQDAAKERTG